ncbi:DUF533 domain-containing protein [Luteolibacter sp. SL250]|uniref:tellurite resistance TerB family protein n=1 Tax=Luteolibacter sp. SL250 TaxID=2995170 RepID=UPI00226DE72C|nr:DUF533 domain-containing protein [Luteolibacter sp. SL250]WAC20623.1 DUF533 domain-containing protein [Luteolibacter sp. SL250]
MSLDSLFSSLSQKVKGDPKALLGSLLGGAGTQGALGGAASGALVSVLMNSKARSKIQKNAVKVGGMAALAGIGYYAYQKWQQSQQVSQTAAALPATPAPAPATPPPPLPANLEVAAVQVKVTGELPMKMILAMIAAAAADGTIDSIEMTALAGAIDQAPVEPAEKARLTSALNAPPTVEHIAGLANGPEEASEIYGAALTAIDLDSPSEHLFLRRLASSLKLDEQLVKTVHETLERE